MDYVRFSDPDRHMVAQLVGAVQGWDPTSRISEYATSTGSLCLAVLIHPQGQGWNIYRHDRHECELPAPPCRGAQLQGAWCVVLHLLQQKNKYTDILAVPVSGASIDDAKKEKKRREVAGKVASDRRDE